MERDEEIIDPFDGIDSIRLKEILATRELINDDPLYILKVAIYAAHWGLSVEAPTEIIMRESAKVFGFPNSTVFRALECAMKTATPSRFFQILQSAGLLHLYFPEIAALVGVPQLTAYHPEGDAFQHSMLVLDKVSAQTDKLLVRFASLVHDLGKSMTPPENYLQHSGHENRVGAILDSWNKRTVFPPDWLDAGKIVGLLHMLVPRIENPTQIFTILEQIQQSPISVQELMLICQADDMTGNKKLCDLSLFAASIETLCEDNAPVGLTPQEKREWVRGEQYEAITRTYNHAVQNGLVQRGPLSSLNK